MTSSAVVTSAVIAAAGLVLSIITATFIAGFRWGQVKTELALVKHQIDQSVTKEELNNVRTDVAEIKGMFRLTLRDGSAN